MKPRKMLCALLLTILGVAAPTTAATQFVYLDFDSGNNSNINYTATMRNNTVQGLQVIYDDFDVVIQDTIPASPYSKVTFNSGSPGGLAQQIDFRNLDPDDTAVVNVDGLGLSVSQYVGASITIGAHELGHLVGLRHGDSFGPIGTGLGSPGPSPGNYLPAFPGPSGGNEVANFVMGTPALGVPVPTVSNQHWLSERSATKLAFAEQGSVVGEAAGPKNTLATAQPISLPAITVPNTIVSGANAGLGDFSVDALSVTGNLSSAGELDLYAFEASAGDLWNIEVMSSAIDQRIGNRIDPQISVLDSTGALINYWGGSAFNDDELETLDSILLDLTIPDDGTYYMQINAYSASDTGGYELFSYRFNGAVPTLPGDFDGNGDYACEDIDSLVAEIAGGTNDPTFDLSGDGLVDGDDLTAWLQAAGFAELDSGGPYLRGDANLDGAVDGADFVVWNASKFTPTAAWCSGDFDASGFVDGNDFVLWNANKFQFADAIVEVGFKKSPDGSHLILNVPEPGGVLAVGASLALLIRRRRRA